MKTEHFEPAHILTLSLTRQLHQRRAAATAAREALDQFRPPVAKSRVRRITPPALHMPALRLPRPARRVAGHLLVLLLALGALLGRNNLSLPETTMSRQLLAEAQPQASRPDLERRPISMLTSSAVGGREQMVREVELAPTNKLPQPRRGPAFKIEHRVSADETLGQIAERYHVNATSLALANGLTDGQMLAIGQTLRVPDVPGVPHVISGNDTLESIAARYNVSLAAIIGYGPNDLVAGDALPVGREIFDRGGSLPIGSAEVSNRSENDLAAIRATPVGTVVIDEANMRQGPSTLFDAIGQLAEGSRLRLLARHENWYEVEHPDGGTGWISVETLDVPLEVAAGLPVTEEVPEFVPTGIVADDHTNLRSGPDVFYQVAGQLMGGSRLRLLARHENWYQVKHEQSGLVGWISGDLLKVRSEVADLLPAASELPEPIPVAVVRDDESNLRAGPGTVYDSVAKLAGGTRLRLVARHKSWFKVRQPDGEVGWMSGDVLNVASAIAEAVPHTDDIPAPPPIWVWPSYGDLTSGFGWRNYPWRMLHDGIDIANAQGTPIVAARNGVVYEAGWCSGFGYCVKMEHDGGFTTIYGHLMSRPVVRAGDYVRAGQLVGYMGTTYDRAGGGYSTGVHLHFTIKLWGEPVNPLRYLP